jgi:predicted RNase H-like nuclease (RuvC/YqgF family)
MNLQAILDKLARGEELTDAERDFLKTHKLQEDLDAAAANARRKAEERAQAAEAAKAEADQRAKEAQDALDAKENEGKPELEKLQAQVEKLNEQIAERDAQIEALSKDKEGLTREAKLQSIFQAAGIAFIDKVDGEAMSGLFKGQFGDLSLEDLDDADKTTPIVETFKTRNEAIIADTSGHGSGQEPTNRITFNGEAIDNPWKDKTLNLTMQGRITRENPELAQRLKKAAGK